MVVSGITQFEIDGSTAPVGNNAMGRDPPSNARGGSDVCGTLELVEARMPHRLYSRDQCRPGIGHCVTHWLGFFMERELMMQGGNAKPKWGETPRGVSEDATG